MGAAKRTEQSEEGITKHMRSPPVEREGMDFRGTVMTVTYDEAMDKGKVDTSYNLAPYLQFTASSGRGE